jgi:D-cysteine desulfhydrase
VGFVNAGLELAHQIATGDLDTPSRIYIANGTMGSVAGLAIGLALTDSPIEIHAVRVADNRFARRVVLDRLIAKTAFILNRIDNSIPAELQRRVRIVWRDEFFAGGYAAVDKRTEQAVNFAREQLQLHLDTTYTGKAMAALLHDDAHDNDSAPCLFWNTYNSRALSTVRDQPSDLKRLPSEFRRYFN